MITRDVLSYFGKRLERPKYKAFVAEGIDKEINSYFSQLKRVPILGSEAFKKTITEKYLREAHKIDEIPEHKQFIKHLTLEQVMQAVANYYQVNIETLKEVNKHQGNLPRKVAIYLAQERTELKQKKIAEGIENMTASGVAQSSFRFAKEIGRNKGLKKAINHIERLLMNGCKYVKT